MSLSLVSCLHLATELTLICLNLSHLLPALKPYGPTSVQAWTQCSSLLISFPAHIPYSFHLSSILASRSFQNAIWPLHTYTHTPLYLISLSLHFHTSCLKPSFFGPGLSPVLSSALYLLGEVILHFHWGILPLMEPLLTAPPPQEPLCALLLPTGGLCLALEMPLSACCLSHCTVSLARTGPSYGLLHPCPLAKGLSHHRYSVNTCWVKFTRAGGSRVRVHVQFYPSPWSAFLTALRCLPRNGRKLCRTPSWLMLSVLWRVVL